MHHNRGNAPAFQGGEAEGFLPVAPALGEAPERAQGPYQPRPRTEAKVGTERVRLPVCRLDTVPQQFRRPAEVARGLVDLPQVMGGVDLQGPIAECSRECEGLLACGNRPVRIARDPSYLGHLG